MNVLFVFVKTQCLGLIKLLKRLPPLLNDRLLLLLCVTLCLSRLLRGPHTGSLEGFRGNPTQSSSGQDAAGPLAQRSCVPSVSRV